MNKAVKTILIVAGSLLLAGIVLFVVALGFGASPVKLWTSSAMPFMGSGVHIGGGLFYRDLNNVYAADGQYSVAADDVKSLDVGWIAGKVEVRVTNESAISFAETAYEPIVEDTALRYGVENGVLYVQYCRNGYYGNLPEKQLILNVPATLAQTMKSFKFDASSAELYMDDISADSIDCDSTSGTLVLSDMAAKAVNLNTSSGEIEFTGAYTTMNADSTSGSVIINSLGTAKKTDVNTSSGEITFTGNCGETSIGSTSGTVIGKDDLVTGKVRINTSSGEIYLEGQTGDLDLGSTSGTIRLELEACPDSIDIDTSSGDVNLSMPADSNFTMDYDTSSGDLQSDFSMVMKGDRYICGDGSNKVRISTTSGGLRMNAD